MEYFWAWEYQDILGSNIRQEKLSTFTKILNYSKFSCIILWSKCLNIPNVHYSQKELEHFGLEILVIYKVLGIFELYQVFMC